MKTICCRLRVSKRLYLHHTQSHAHGQCFDEIKNGVFFRTAAGVFFSIELLGDFDSSIALRKGPIKRKKPITLSTRSVNLQDCENIYGELFTRIGSRRTLEQLLVDISDTIEKRISVVAPARAFV